VALAFVALGVFLARVEGWSGGGWIAGVATALWLAVAAFFRVPRRRMPDVPGTLLSPADGVVKDIETVRDHGIEPFEGRPMLRIGIFLSVLDVHVNRAPCDWTVEWRRYRKGRFLDARDPRCAKENESMTLAGTGRTGGLAFPLAVRQISGAIARRIVCDPQPEATLRRGEIYGMIKFGSRTELYLPAEGRIVSAVKIGDKVRAGTTIVATTTIGDQRNE